VCAGERFLNHITAFRNTCYEFPKLFAAVRREEDGNARADARYARAFPPRALASPSLILSLSLHFGMPRELVLSVEPAARLIPVRKRFNVCAASSLRRVTLSPRAPRRTTRSTVRNHPQRPVDEINVASAVPRASAAFPPPHSFNGVKPPSQPRNPSRQTSPRSITPGDASVRSSIRRLGREFASAEMSRLAMLISPLSDFRNFSRPGATFFSLHRRLHPALWLR